MGKLLSMIVLAVLLASCAVNPVSDSDNPRTLFLVSISMTYGDENARNHISETENRMDIMLALEDLYKSGYTGFDEIDEIIFDEVDGSYCISGSVSSSGGSGRWTLHDDIIPALEDIAGRADGNDLLIIFICGHGEADGSLLFYNPDASGEMDILPPEDFISLMDGIGCNKLAILLTCYSGRIADLGDGTMSSGSIVSGKPGSFSEEFSLIEAMSDSFLLQSGSSRSGNGRLWVITAARHDQESFSFNYTDRDGRRMTWDPFADYAAQSFAYDPERGCFRVTGTGRLSALDVSRNIARLYAIPMLEAASSMPDEMREAFIGYGMEDSCIMDFQVMDHVLSPVDLVLF